MHGQSRASSNDNGGPGGGSHLFLSLESSSSAVRHVVVILLIHLSSLLLDGDPSCRLLLHHLHAFPLPKANLMGVFKGRVKVA